MENFKLNPDDKKKWVDALRSGNYKQGRQQLHWLQEDSYCCLGVAKEIGLKNAIENRYGTFLKESFLHLDIQHYLGEMNDNCGMTFSEIADWIEKNL